MNERTSKCCLEHGGTKGSLWFFGDFSNRAKMQDCKRGENEVFCVVSAATRVVNQQKIDFM